MTTQYTPTLKLALPVTGELSGTWGDVVNDNITSMIEQAIAGLATINSWTGNAHTLTTANGTTSESRCAMLVAATGGGAPSAAAEIICPAAAKLYVLQNNTSYAVTLKTSAGTGVAVAAGDTAFLFCDGTNVNSCVTTIVNGHITGNLTVDGNATINGNTTLGNATSDTVTVTARVASNVLPSADNTYDLGASANAWKDLYIDGTATMALVAISGGTINGVSIGATTPATFLAVDNLSLDGNTIASTDTNGNIVIAPNGTGDVQLDADTVRVGDSGAAATLTSNGAGALTVTTGGAADLTLSTNSGTDSGTVVIANGVNGNITLTPNGTGDVILSADRVQIGDSNTDTTLTTNGTGSLNLTTNNGTNSGTIQIAQGANGNITLTPNGTGSVSVPKLVWSNGTATRVPYLTTGGQFTDSANLTFNGTDLTVSGAVNAGTINATTLDLTNLEVTNIKAKDGTASITLADSTGVASFTANPVLSGGTANGVLYLNGSKSATSGSAFAFDGSKLTVNSNSTTTAGFFQINDGTTTQANSFGSVVRNSNDGNGRYSLGAFTLQNASGLSQYAYIGAQAITGASNYTPDMVFGLSTGASTYAEKMRLDSAGTLFVNTTARPSGVGGGDNGKLWVKQTTTGNYGIASIASATDSFISIAHNGTVGVVGTSYGTTGSYTPLAFYTTDLERARIDASGNLGIGTSSPAGKLDVFSNTGTTAPSARFYVNANGNTPSSLQGFAIYNNVSGGLVDTTLVAGNTANTYMAFGIHNGTSYSERMRISSAGNVGIGTSSPASILHVKQTTGSATITVDYNGTNVGRVQANSNGNMYLGLTTGSGSVSIGTTSASDAIYVASGGNVGIGTTSPGYTLDVVGTTFLRTTNIYSSTGGPVNSSTLTFGSAALPAAASIYGKTDTATAGNLVFATAQSGTGTMTERGRFDGDGKMGIGTASPQQQLEVSGSSQAGIIYERISNAYGSLGSAGSGTALQFYGWDAGVTANIKSLRIGSSYSPSALTIETFGGNGNAGSNTLAERARIDEYGSFLYGFTSSPSGNYKFYVANDLNVYTATDASGTTTLRLGSSLSMPQGIATIAGVKTAVGAGDMAFNTATGGSLAERGRITSGGQFLFGTTTANVSRWGRANFYYASGTSNPTIGLQNGTARASGNKYGIIFADNTDESNAAVYVNQNNSGNNAADLLFGTNSGTGGATFSAITERMRITAGGDALVGTSASTGSVSNTARIVGGVINSANAVGVTALNATATTIFTLTNIQASQTWIVSADVAGQSDTTPYACVYLVVVNYNGATGVTQLRKGSLSSISVSGLNVQYTQSSGGTQTSVAWGAIRIM